VHPIDADSPAPIGSVLKLAVLAVLATAVAAGKVRWDQPLTVTAQLKNLPSGVLARAGRHADLVPDAATKMISNQRQHRRRHADPPDGPVRGRGGADDVDDGRRVAGRR
jgi:hypothetical protein